MKANDFSNSDLVSLCRLYFDGKLSRPEEVSLEQLLSSRAENLPSEAEEALEVMKVEKHMVRREKRRNELLKSRSFLRIAIGMAAAVILGVFLWLNFSTPTSDVSDETFIVWKNGKRLNDKKEVEAIVEENQQIDMEMLRRVMRKQREELKGTYAIVDFDDYE